MNNVKLTCSHNLQETTILLMEKFKKLKLITLRSSSLLSKTSLAIRKLGVIKLLKARRMRWNANSGLIRGVACF